jgi:hypothetical protein
MRCVLGCNVREQKARRVFRNASRAKQSPGLAISAGLVGPTRRILTESVLPTAIFPVSDENDDSRCRYNLSHPREGTARRIREFPLASPSIRTDFGENLWNLKEEPSAIPGA